MHSHDISLKANRVLHLITLSFLIILIRVWYLSVIAHDSYEELSKKPQKKTVIEKPNRGTIRDRFNIPLAVNKLQYDVGICYDQIRQIPAIKRTSLSNGNIEKTYPFGQLRSYLYHADINTLYLQLFSFLIKHHTLLNSKTFNNPMDQENFICEEFNAPPPDVFG